MISKIVLSSLLYMLLGSTLASNTKIRVVTWNVLRNSRMNDGFTDEAIDKVLGLDKEDAERPSIYAIGLQENCWKCNKNNLHKLGEAFVRRINRKTSRKYDLIRVYGTRMSNSCQLGCMLKMLGTTALLVIGERSLAASSTALRQNKGCSSRFFGNKEKGISAIKVSLGGEKTICFATGHLDSKSSRHRRKCMKNFFSNANRKVSWTTSCDAEFIFGDFNTRTGDKMKGPSAGKYYSMKTQFPSLRQWDELAGDKPYGMDYQWKSNLLSYINQVQAKTFIEGSFSFMPTYSIQPAKKYCDGQFPCYRTNRPMSWTDRIIYTKGKLLKYDAIYKEYSDHFPVYAEFKLSF